MCLIMTDSDKMYYENLFDSNLMVYANGQLCQLGKKINK